MKIVKKTDNRILIEHDNFRSLVTQELYKHYEDGELSPEELVESGVPISVQWSDFIKVSVTAKDIEDTFYQYGIHTLDDLLNSPQKVSGAILKTVGITSSDIYKAVKKQQMGE